MNAHKVLRKGVAGSAVMVWRTLVTGGVAGARQLQLQRVISPAVNAIVHVGTKKPFRKLVLASLASKHQGKSPTPAVTGRTVVVQATAYTVWDQGCTGSIGWVRGRMAHYHIPSGWGIIAVDPRVIALGTRVYVPGYGYAVAADTGGAIKGHIIDVCYWGADPRASVDHLEPGQKSAAFAAMDRWGRRYGIRVTILGR
jgi:3D (Asp-Asp-Asp) domain-containing protein